MRVGGYKPYSGLFNICPRYDFAWDSSNYSYSSPTLAFSLQDIFDEGDNFVPMFACGQPFDARLVRPTHGTSCVFMDKGTCGKT